MPNAEEKQIQPMFNTQLEPLEEVLFQSWMRANNLTEPGQDVADVEPQLDYRGLYRSTGGQVFPHQQLKQSIEQMAARQTMLKMLTEQDGQQDLEIKREEMAMKQQEHQMKMAHKQEEHAFKREQMMQNQQLKQEQMQMDRQLKLEQHQFNRESMQQDRQFKLEDMMVDRAMRQQDQQLSMQDQAMKQEQQQQSFDIKQEQQQESHDLKQQQMRSNASGSER